MKKQILLIVFLVSITVPGAAASRIVERIVALVDNEIILLSELEKRGASAGVPPAKEEDFMSEARRQQALERVLWQMIDDLLVKKKAGEMKINVENIEVERAIDNVALQNGVSRAGLFEAIRKQGLTVDGYRRDIRRQLLKHKVMSLKVRGRVRISDEEARRFYNGQVREVRSGDAFVGAHIVIKVPPSAGAATVAARRRVADKALEKLREGVPFEEVAAEMSEDEGTAQSGGVIGRHMPGEIRPELDRAYLDMEPGEISGPVRSSMGFHILKLIEREASAVMPFSDVRDRIKAQLIEVEMAKQEKLWIEELRRLSYIDVRL